MAGPSAPEARTGFTIAIICALQLEAESVRAIFDRCWNDEGKEYGKEAKDNNTYTTGVIGQHNVVLVLLPGMGNIPAAQAATNLSSSYREIQLVLVVGVCGVVPVNPTTGEEIVLGDVIVSKTVIQYDFGSTYPGGFRRKTSVQDSLRKAPKGVQGFVNNLSIRQNRQSLRADLIALVDTIRSTQDTPEMTDPGAIHDHLYDASYVHEHRTSLRCSECYDGLVGICSRSCHELGCDPEKRITRQRLQSSTATDQKKNPDRGPLIHFGSVGSANTVIKSGAERDQLADKEKLIAFEMEGAGVWDEHPTIMIKGACDYADSHKNKGWQPYAAMMAAACLKVVLARWVTPDKLPDSGMSRPVGLGFKSAPFLEPQEFIGRKKEIDDIHKLLDTKNIPLEQRRVVLSGISGVGKTQLAIAYARQHTSSYTSILWLNATSEQTLFTSLRLIARETGAPEQPNLTTNEQVLNHFQAWLSRVDSTRWLLIFDDYDDADQFDLDSFCPNEGRGSIIVTTRFPDKISGAKLQVQPLAAADGLAVLRVRSKRNDVENDPGARRLAERMEGLPLALVTAGTLLRNHPMSCQQYMDDYDKEWQVDRGRPLQLNDYSKSTLYNTWDLSYNRLKMENPEAAQVLKLLAYFDNQDVWCELLQTGFSDHASSSLPASISDRVRIMGLMSALVDYGFVDVQYRSQSYRMHSSVHDWALGALNREIDVQLYFYAFDCVAGSIDKSDPDLLGNIGYARLSRHALRLTHHRFATCDRLGSDLLEHLDEAVWIAKMLEEQVQLAGAEQIYVQVLAGYEKVLGPEHVSTLKTMNDLGRLYRTRDKFAEAEQILTQGMIRCERALGPAHTTNLDILHNLGILYREQDKLDEAEQMLNRALRGREQALGLDHKSTNHTLRSLGVLHHIRRDVDKAEQTLDRALASYEKTLGPDHASTLETVHQLSRVYRAQRKFPKAEAMLNRALAGRERIFAPSHSATLATVNNLGLLYENQAKLEEAEPMLERALDGNQNALGPEHTTTLGAANNLGILYREQGRLTEAEQMLDRAARGQEKVLGSKHSQTLITITNLGLVYHDQDKLEEAEQMLLQALTGRDKVFGPNHRKTLSTAESLGNLYLDEEKLAEAEEMLNQALLGYRKTLGLDDPSTLGTATRLGLVFHARNMLAEAEQVYLKVLAQQEKLLGSEDISTLDTVYSLSCVYRDLGRLADAQTMLDRALNGYKKKYAPEHTTISMVESGLGVLYHTQGKLVEAEQTYGRALNGYEKALGPDHRSTLWVVSCLSDLCFDHGKLSETKELLDRVLVGYQKAVGSGHTSTLWTINSLGILYCAEDKLTEAERMFSQARAGYEEALDEEHPARLAQMLNVATLAISRHDLGDARELHQQIITTSTKYLSEESSPSQVTVNTLAAALCQSVSLSRDVPVDVKPDLLNLIGQYRLRGEGNVIVVQSLARALLYLDDDKNVRNALMFHVPQASSNPSDLGGQRCDACHRRLNVSIGMKVCRRCVGMILCNQCHSAKMRDADTAPACQHSRFYDFASVLQQARNPSRSRDPAEVETWLARMERQYRLLPDDAMRSDEDRAGSWASIEKIWQLGWM